MIETLVFLAYVGAIIAFILGFKYMLDHKRNRILQGETQEDERTPFLIKKHYAVDMAKYSSLFFNIGLVISVAASLTAFEWKMKEEKIVHYTSSNSGGDGDIISPTVIIDIPEPKPELAKVVVKQPEIKIIKDNDVADDVVIDFTPTTTTSTTNPPTVVDTEPIEDIIEPVEDYVVIAEQNAEFEGGMEAFYAYLSKEIKYPKQARKQQIEGRVFAEFVVDKEGNVTNVKVVKGIGGGCDEEAIRVLSSSPKWKPAKQRGKTVKIKMVMPIMFNLN